MIKSVKTITRKDFNKFIENLIKDEKYEVVGVKSKGKRFVFDRLENIDELRLDYDVTILPPKKYFLPPYEKLMDFTLDKKVKAKKNVDAKIRILVGVHPYDIIALEQTDKLYFDPQKDDFYKKRRKNTIIIGTDIQKVSDKSFAASMGTHVTDSGFDLMVTDLITKYAITVGSRKGEDLLVRYARVKDAKESDIKKIRRSRENIAKQYKRSVNVDKNKWGSFLVANYNHAIWEENSDKCLECGSCVMVCPTCFCYDVRDEVSLDLKTGERIRTWDGCLLRDFTKVASGEIFREDVRERYRHRFFRKGNYLYERYGFVACVGCGRCVSACLPGIADPCKLINELSHFEKSEDTDRFIIKQESKTPKIGTIHIPRIATIKRMEKLTETETLFEIELNDKKPLGHKPGQFVEISVFGVGEAPISVSSPPSKSDSFEIVVRKVGSVTSRLFAMKPGDAIGIRGPFGTSFDIEYMKNKNILFVSGGLGMVPMRSLIGYVLDKTNRKNFRNITILYGAKQPREVLFMNEIKKWEKIKDVVCKLTVDQCADGECWVGEVGLITTLFPKIKLDKADSNDTIAVVVGPPIMYKFVIKCLQTLGFPDENIVVSLERRMKCGVGKCGHCQINGVYVCKEGPVFNYNDIKNLPEAFE